MPEAETKSSLSLGARLALVVGGGLCGLMFALLALQFIPALRPTGGRFVFTDLDGDTFRHQPGFVRPPAENRILEDFIRRSDADGFRLPRLTADSYPLVALGDSFTEGGETNWVDTLAEKLGRPVRNLGWRGFGPLHYAAVWREFRQGGEDWVLIGYFEGNDLSNIRTAEEAAAQTGTLDIQRLSVPAQAHPPRPTLDPQATYLYPLTHFLPDERRLDLAYISDYLWWLNGDLETYQNSRNFALLAQALSDIQSTAGVTCVALVYIPSKEHLYSPYADPTGNLRYVLENGLALELDAEGWLTFGAVGPQDRATVLARLDNQRKAVRFLAQDLGLVFIDLLPPLQAALGGGEALYYPYDSHWSALGHQVAGESVAAALEAVGSCR
jgi:hypothetical protein